MSLTVIVVILLLVGGALYLYGLVRRLMARSDEQWDEVDRSKLKEWEDDEDDWR